MNFGNGSFGFSNRSESGGGAATANNGVSVDGSDIVFGNDPGGTDAMLLSDREIPLNGKTLDFLGEDGDDYYELLITPEETFISAQVGDTSFDLTMNLNTVQLARNAGNTIAQVKFNDGVVPQAEFSVSSFLTSRKAGFLINSTVNANDDTVVSFIGDAALQTGRIAGDLLQTPWKLGPNLAGAFAVDATRALKVEVNGVVYQLAVVV